MSLDLAQLIAPLSVDDFFKKHWPQEYLFLPATKGKLDSVLNLPILADLESLVRSRVKKVRACLPDHDDEYSSIHLEPSDALKAYRNNMTLVFDSMQTQDEFIDSSLRNLREDLGLLMGPAESNLCKARSIAYATPAGAGTSLHFDANVNFVIQIRGSKKWMLAKNQSVENPTERFTANALEMPMALEYQCHAPLIEEMPKDAIQVLMEPGCVLMVPRGYWHSTTTEEDSLSLNFTFSQPTWADVFTKSMQELLLKSPEWRALADGLESKDSKRKDQAIATFAAMVDQLSMEMTEISGVDLLRDSALIPE